MNIFLSFSGRTRSGRKCPFIPAFKLWLEAGSIIFYGEYEEREVLAFVLGEVITSPRVDHRDFFNSAMIRPLVPSLLCFPIFNRSS